MRRTRARRRAFLPAAIFLLCLAHFPHPLLAARLMLRTDGGGSAATALVGDVVDVDVWVDAGSATLSGAAVFLSYDGDVFELLEQDRDPVVSGFQPFAPGGFFANGEIFRNALLDPEDPAASPAGEQLDYSVVRAVDTGAGAIASFRLRALAPTAGSTIRIDESGIRETRVFLPDGSRDAFRFIEPLTIAVRGIGIEGLPAELVLARGQVDSTTFRLDDLLFDPLYGPDVIAWHVDASPALDIRMDDVTRRVIVTAPLDRSLWEQLTLRAVNPDGQTASAQIELFVNAGPQLAEIPTELDLTEDSQARLWLDDFVEDPDTPDAQLAWTVEAAPSLGARIEGPPSELVLEPRADWFGDGRVRLTVSDRFGFADTVDVDVRVAAVNDPPRALLAPNLRITRGKADSTLTLAALFADADDDLDDLVLSWEGAARVGLTRSGPRLVVSAPADWEGDELIAVTATDAGGRSAVTSLTVSVVASLAPAVTGAPQRFGLAPGTSQVLDLTDWVRDPDDPAVDLVWAVSGQSQLLVQVSTTGAVRIEAPEAFAGAETVRFHAVDPSGESTHFDVVIFAAPAGGSPVVAPLPTLSLPAGGVDASVDLDDFIYDLDDAPEALTWSVSGPEGVDLRVDAVSHVLSIAAADSVAGAFELILRAVDPAGHEAVGTIGLTIAPTGDTPGTPPGDGDPDPGVDPGQTPTLTLLPLPTVRLPEGGFDRSLVVDQFVADGDAAAFRWEAESGQHVQALIDPTTRQVTVLAEPGWTGPDLVTLRAFDAQGNLIAEALIGVQVRAVAAALDLRDLVETRILTGDTLLTISPDAILAAGPEPANLTWEVPGESDLRLVLTETGSLALSGAFGDAGDRAVTIVAHDSSGLQASGTLMVHVLATDGSAGIEREGFRLAVVPNPVQPEFLDLYVRSDVAGTPRLRALADAGSELALSPVTDGIWHATHALAVGMEGTVSFVALSLDSEDLLRDRRDLVVGTVPAAAGKVVAGSGFRIETDADAFDGPALIAVIPDGRLDPVAAFGAELRPAGTAVRVHATRALRTSPRLTLRADRPGSHAYRWDDTDARWRFVGGVARGDGIVVELDRLGRYGLFIDATPPVIRVADGAIDVHDGGSGVAEVAALVDGQPLPGGVLFVDGVARLTDRVPADARVTLRAVDRAGNASVTELADVANRLPATLSLGQNYPNPFNPETTIPVRLAGGALQLEIYNAAGQRVRRLFDGDMAPGEHRVLWDGRDDTGHQVSSGTYFARAVSLGGTQVRRMTLAR